MQIYSIFLLLCYNGVQGGGSMDMMKCKACGKDIARNAGTCPHCGYKVPMSNTSAAFTLIALAVLVFFIGGMVVSCGNKVLFPIFFP
jgi:hypothetical protein